MKRWVYFSLCAIFGLALLVVAWRIPAHLRAVDAEVIQRAGHNSPGIIERGLALVRAENPGAAQLLLQAAQQEQISGYETLRAAIEDSQRTHPKWLALGTNPRLKTLFEFVSKSRVGKSKLASAQNSQAKILTAPPKVEPFTELIILSENREKTLALLRNSPYPVVQQLLRTRALTNTVLFSPAQSTSGQAFDAALSIGGLLLEGQHLSPGLTNAIFTTVTSAMRGENSQPLEQILLDFISLGQRFNWGQLAAFCQPIDSAETLRLQANLARKMEGQLPVLFSVVQLSENSAGVAAYLMNFGQTGQKDLGASLHFGAGGVNEVLKRNQRLHRSRFQGKVNTVSGAWAYLPWRNPELALALKWLLYLCAGFLLALAVRFAWPSTSVLERPFQGAGFQVAREMLFALGFLLVVLILSEPFLVQENQNVEFPIRLQLPTVGSVAPAESTGADRSIMNQLSLLTLLLFFVLQALLYVASLVKLAEIRRQTFSSHIKMKLLENEDHLFDAGLYLGFAGTIISLILVSMGIIKPSLMAAYSATAFGVIFVSLFKIFHVRPYRRKLLLEAEASRIAAPAPSEHTLSAPL